MRDFFKIAGSVIALVLIVDAFGFLAWVFSGQHPLDNFYIGTITAHALQIFIK